MLVLKHPVLPAGIEGTRRFCSSVDLGNECQVITATQSRDMALGEQGAGYGQHGGGYEEQGDGYNKYRKEYSEHGG